MVVVKNVPGHVFVRDNPVPLILIDLYAECAGCVVFGPVVVGFCVVLWLVRVVCFSTRIMSIVDPVFCAVVVLWPAGLLSIVVGLVVVVIVVFTAVMRDVLVTGSDTNVILVL